MVSAIISNVDVCSVISDEQTAYVNYLHVAYGSIVRFHNMESKRNWKKAMRMSFKWWWSSCAADFNPPPKDVILPVSIDLRDDIRVTVPQKGEKKVLDLNRCKK